MERLGMNSPFLFSSSLIHWSCTILKAYRTRNEFRELICNFIAHANNPKTDLKFLPISEFKGIRSDLFSLLQDSSLNCWHPNPTNYLTIKVEFLSF